MLIRSLAIARKSALVPLRSKTFVATCRRPANVVRFFHASSIQHCFVVRNLGKENPIEKLHERNVCGSKRFIVSETRIGNRESPQSTRHILSKRFDNLLQQIDDLPLLPAIWEQGNIDKPDPRRQQVFRETLSIMNAIHVSVDSGWIDTSGQHRVELSKYFDWALRGLSVSQSDDPSFSKYDLCVKIMACLNSWNVNVQHSHCDSAMLVAAREGRWREAAELFSSRIDPDCGGHSPINISVKYPIGLYCMARYAQEIGNSPVDSVFNGVLHMSIVSPSDQDRYVLAAGTALGHAGESDSMIQYVRTSLNAKQLGQPLIAATMHACLLNNRPDDALRMFDTLTGGEHHASIEWQVRTLSLAY